MTTNSDHMATINELLTYLEETLVPMLPADLATQVTMRRQRAFVAWTQLCSQLPEDGSDGG